mmetsp:Transcript_108325/g.305415  ORF Transcript_108325/g.305415 Transcript_108325/m.305415 type:complete len:260 (+) Transcript_108325:64-843(+)
MYSGGHIRPRTPAEGRPTGRSHRKVSRGRVHYHARDDWKAPLDRTAEPAYRPKCSIDSDIWLDQEMGRGTSRSASPALSSRSVQIWHPSRTSGAGVPSGFPFFDEISVCDEPFESSSWSHRSSSPTRSASYGNDVFAPSELCRRRSEVLPGPFGPIMFQQPLHSCDAHSPTLDSARVKARLGWDCTLEPRPPSTPRRAPSGRRMVQPSPPITPSTPADRTGFQRSRRGHIEAYRPQSAPRDGRFYRPVSYHRPGVLWMY